MFTQASLQPQVQVAFSQLSTVLSAARQGSLGTIYSHRGGRIRRSHAAANADQQKQNAQPAKQEPAEEETACSSANEQQERESLLAVTSLDVQKELENIMKDVSVKDGHQRWRESHVSTDSFFENKNGFREDCLQQTMPSPPVNIVVRPDRALHILDKGLHRMFLQQTRGFMSKRTREQEAVQKDVFTEALNKFVRPTDSQTTSKTIPLGKIDQPSEQVLEVYRRGLADGKTEKKNRMYYARIFAVLVVVVWLLLNVRVKFGGLNDLGIMSKADHLVDPETVTVTFQDVRGVDEAKQELQDVVGFLRDPGKFSQLGATLPKGVLLVGPPGIGKTMLAKAVAGEAGVPFFQASGSEFDEVFVGSGSRKVRNLFKAAKMHAPCVIFLDEIDSVGAKRTSSQLHPFANQTINQLLSEMDGFTHNEGVIVIGATNKKVNLDNALLRPGRFDVEVNVQIPDKKGRREIFELYLTKIKYDQESVDLETLAGISPGMTGADIRNVVNQAALKASQDGATAVTMKHFEFAKDKLVMGPAWKKVIEQKDKWVTAYHEAGHTIVAYFTKDAPSLHKVTILPRGPSLGHTAFNPDDSYSSTKSNLLAQMDVGMGGRVAEEIIYGKSKVTTGASSDFSMATNIATSMVKRCGMSDKIGVRVFEDNPTNVSLIGAQGQSEVGPVLRDAIDSEIKRILEESYERARNILTTYAVEHKALATALVENETLSKEQVEHIIKTRKPIMRVT